MDCSRRNFLGCGSLLLTSGAARAAVPEMHTLTPVPIEQVALTDDFWAPKMRVWRQVTIRDCFRKFENDRGGALNNFDRVRDGLRGGHAGPPWYDGLVYQMIRGAADFLRAQSDAALDAQLDGYIARIAAAAAKHPRGYLNTYTQLEEPGHEWGLHGGLNLYQHELYNAGAMVDAGVHHYRATGKTALLVPAVRFANHMREAMGPPPRQNIVPCHPLAEEALVGLYELFRENPGLKNRLPVPVEEADYLALAEFWIEARGRHIGKPNWDGGNWKAAEAFVRRQEYGEGRPSWGAYAQDDKPVFEQETIRGHAVRATLLCAGIAAAARVNRRPEYLETAERLWRNMVDRRMHVTGGVGAFAQEEKFGPDYILPNDAYLETCAAVGAAFFHRNMNLAFAEARYVDELERALYNGALAGVSLQGDTYFYMNPLECDKRRVRWSWHDCPCCPPMFLKLMGALPGYIYATDASGLYVNLFVGSRARTSVGGVELSIRQTTRYPWDGAVRMAVDPVRPGEFSLMVRLPAWSRGQTLKVNGVRLGNVERCRGYARITRTWKRGDTVELDLPMPVEAVRANPQVEADAGKVALQRGPLVYCLESADNGDAVRSLSLRTASGLTGEHRAELLGGVTLIHGEAISRESPAWRDTLYRAVRESAAPVRFSAIPYFANANRGPVNMAVWLPEFSR